MGTKETENPIEHEVIIKLTSIDTKLDFLHRDFSRIIFAMLGIIAANLGMKFIGSPAHIIIFTYVALFAVVFMLSNLVSNWNKLDWLTKTFRTSITTLIMFSVTCRILIFEVGIQFPPMWYTPVIDILFIIICVLTVMRTWKRWEG